MNHENGCSLVSMDDLDLFSDKYLAQNVDVDMQDWRVGGLAVHVHQG